MDGTTRSSYAHRFKKEHILSQEDFYPPQDARVLRSYICDIKDGDNFVDYTTYIFKLYEQEDWYEN